MDNILENFEIAGFDYDQVSGQITSMNSDGPSQIGFKNRNDIKIRQKFISKLPNPMKLIKNLSQFVLF